MLLSFRQGMAERSEMGDRFEKGSVSKAHFLSLNSVSLYCVAWKVTHRNEAVGAVVLSTVWGLRG